MGAMGLAGPRGLTGAAGEKGERGASGPAGSDGAPGMELFQLCHIRVSLKISKSNKPIDVCTFIYCNIKSGILTRSIILSFRTSGRPRSTRSCGAIWATW